MVNSASKEVAFGLDLTLYKGSGSPFDGLAHLDSSTAKTEIARPARAIKEGEGVAPYAGTPWLWLLLLLVRLLY